MSLFELGRVVMTSGIRDLIENDPERVVMIDTCLRRHGSGDFGNICDDDRELNEDAIRRELDGERYTDSIMSVYDIYGEEIWIITEWDRSVTTILTPDEY